MRNLRPLALAGVISLVAVAALAQPAIYGSPPPEGAAFVRVIHVAPAAPAIRVDLGAVRYGSVAPGEVTPYRPLAEGVYLLRVPRPAGTQFELVPRASRFYTVLFSAAGPSMLEDPRHTDSARAQIILYNVSTLDDIRLVAAGEVEVLAPVAAGAARSVAVNPVRIALQVRSTDGVVLSIDDPQLARGKSRAFVVYTTSAGPALLATTAEVANP